MHRFALAATLLIAACGIAQAQTPAAPAAPRPPALVITSSAFEDGGIIPDKYTQKASPTAPSIPFSWVNTPAGTQSFVLMLHDLDVVTNKSMTDSLHWLAWNIPATATSLPEGVLSLSPSGLLCQWLTCKKIENSVNSQWLSWFVVTMAPTNRVLDTGKRENRDK